MLKAKTTRKVYDNSGNEWDVHGWYLLKNCLLYTSDAADE